MKFSQFTYKRPHLEVLKKDFQAIVQQFSKASTCEEQVELINQLNDLRSQFDSMFNIASIRHSLNIEDKDFETEQNYFDQNGPEFQALIHDYYRALVKSKFRAELSEKYGKQLFAIAELTLKTFDTVILEDLKRENTLSSEYQKLIASAKINFEGQELNLKALDPYCMSTDRKMRKKANKAKWDFLAKKQNQLDEIFDKLVKVRTSIAQKLGFKNFVELGYARMLRTDYTPEMVKEFRKKVKEYVVPATVELRKRQSKRIGIDDMKFYDTQLYFKQGNPTPKGDPQWILENGRKMYEEMSPETDSFFKFMLENELLDVLNRTGKASGGYCTYITEHKSPFIFSNFNGTSADIDVLTHEAGHAFQVYSSRDISIPEYLWPTYEAAEIHSMSMEFFAWPWMDNFFKEESDKYRFEHLSSCLFFLPYGVAVDEFQHIIYQNPDMTPKERRKTWRMLEEEYMPNTDYDGNDYLDNGGYWQKQSHIYQMPFYYIDYTLAQICAFQFWKKAKEKPEEAFSDYLRLCKAGGSRSFLGLVDLANLKSPFDSNCLPEIVGDIHDYLRGISDDSL